MFGLIEMVYSYSKNASTKDTHTPHTPLCSLDFLHDNHIQFFFKCKNCKISTIIWISNYYLWTHETLAWKTCDDLGKVWHDGFFITEDKRCHTAQMKMVAYCCLRTECQHMSPGRRDTKLIYIKNGHSTVQIFKTITGKNVDSWSNKIRKCLELAPLMIWYDECSVCDYGSVVIALLHTCTWPQKLGPLLLGQAAAINSA